MLKYLDKLAVQIAGEFGYLSFRSVEYYSHAVVNMHCILHLSLNCY